MAEFPITIGWKEWISLPDLGIERLKAKIDTGARTSSLHTYYTEPFYKKGALMLRFGVHPMQKQSFPALDCEALVTDKRLIKTSSGEEQYRYIIVTNIKMGSFLFPVELSLANRDTMKFRMLLGRTALKSRFIIDPYKKYLL